MDFSLLGNFRVFKVHSKSDKGVANKFTHEDGGLSTETAKEQLKHNPSFEIKLWGWSLLSVVPWAINATQKVKRPTTINKELKRQAKSQDLDSIGSRSNPVRFRPYVCKVPWHTGARAFLSQLFPRYGHYCGPNWSSGKDGGSLLWDKRPIDWLDYCCYCHDIGYDNHDQAELLKADLAFLECLERPHMATKGNTHVAHVYKTMCITGLRNVLIPYRSHLLKLQSAQPLVNFGWLSNVKPLVNFSWLNNVKPLVNFGWLSNVKWRVQDAQEP